MRHLNPRSPLALMLLMLAGCTAKHIAYKAEPQLAPEKRAHSVPIWLPRTVLDFRLTGIVTITEPSLLYRQTTNDPANQVKEAKALLETANELGLEVNTNLVKETTYAFKDPVLSARGERDPEAMFYVKLKRGPFSKAEFNGQFAPDGIPGSIASSAENRGFEFTMKTIEVAAGIAGKATAIGLMDFPAGGGDSTDSTKTNLPLQNRIKSQIQRLRGERQALVTGQTLNAQIDEKTLGKMLDEIDKAEASLTAFFTGATKVKMIPLVATIRPDKSYTPSFALLRFDKTSGFAPADPCNGVQLSPIPPELQAKTSPSLTIAIRFSDQNDSERGMWNILEGATASERGLPYRVPARTAARVVLTDDQNNEVRALMAADALIAQWGRVAYLPSSMGGPGSAFKPVYYSETGSLKELTATATALSPDSLSSLEKSTGSITDVLKAKADRDAAAAKDRAAKDDELNQLKREADILEQRVRIQGLQERLPTSD